MPLGVLVGLVGVLVCVLALMLWQVVQPPRIERSAAGPLPLLAMTGPPSVGVLPLRGTPDRAVGPWPHHVVGHTVRFGVPANHRPEPLPGALQILSGPDSGRRIPFLQLPHAPGRTMTIGRRAGVPLHHIELRDPTANRSHASVSHDGEGWILRNLASDNPSELNGRLLAPGESARLHGGDHVRMGEVRFVYRA